MTCDYDSHFIEKMNRHHPMLSTDSIGARLSSLYQIVCGHDGASALLEGDTALVFLVENLSWSPWSLSNRWHCWCLA